LGSAGSHSNVKVPPFNKQIPVELWRQLLLCQLNECSNDIRQNDSILWQIPATIGAIVGLMLNALGNDVLSGPVTGLDIAGVSIGVIVTFSLVLTEYKNRVLQISRNVYRKSIYDALLQSGVLAPGALITPKLSLSDDPCDLPGLVETSSRRLDDPTIKAASEGAGPAMLGSLVARRSAYKALFAISNTVLLAEVLLLGWLVARYV
jgi:hypothetical protein